MVKKAVKKKTSPKKKKISIKDIPKDSPNRELEKVLIENFVSLQKVMVNLSSKFDDLTKKISKLLELFEISAKSLAEKDFDFRKGDKGNKKMIEKMDKLLDQNKIIARGVAMMHEKPQESIQQEKSAPNIRQEKSAPSPPQQKSPALQNKASKEITPNAPQGYQKSISMNPQENKKQNPKFKQLPKRKNV